MEQMNNAKQVNNATIIYEELCNDLSVLYINKKFSDKYFQKPVEFIINSKTTINVGEVIYVEKNGTVSTKFNIDEYFYKYFKTISDKYFSYPFTPNQPCE
jgi:hypothetical protein